jgi:NAD(P)-dependent dehydrogenase (short-subunit alcohol dehydrogenase family)
MSKRGLFDLTGKVVVSTGANSGLGLGFLEGCAQQGADVVVWGRRADKNEEACAHLKALGAPRAHAEAVDVADEAAVERAMAGTLAAMGRVDCFFQNAGFSSMAPSFPDMTSETYHALMAVNQHGAFYSLRAASRHMRERAQAGDRGGSIVACGSLSIFQGRQGLEHYGAAKSAVAAMIKGIAVEMGQYGVRANMLAVGFIRTAMTDSPQARAVAEHMAAVTPLGRPGEISDIHGAAAYLASDASAFHTGDVFVIDGGRLVKG